jgi:hypothetical protein
LPVVRLRFRVLVGALWHVRRRWSMCVLSAGLPFGYIGPSGVGVALGGALSFDYGGDPCVRCGCSMPFGSIRRHTGVVASSRLRATFRPHPRHRWCRCVVWSRMRAALRLRRWCSVVVGSLRRVRQALPCDRRAWAAMSILFDQPSPKDLWGGLSFSPFLCFVGVCVFSFSSPLCNPRVFYSFEPIL